MYLFQGRTTRSSSESGMLCLTQLNVYPVADRVLRAIIPRITASDGVIVFSPSNIKHYPIFYALRLRSQRSFFPDTTPFTA